MDVDDRLIFKFPRSPAAEQALYREVAVLAVVRPFVSMPVPDIALHDGPPMFSLHEKLPGERLLSAHYDALPDHARRRLGGELGRFYAELHRLDVERMSALDAGPIAPWRTPDCVRAKAIPALPHELRARAEGLVDAFEALPPDPYGATYGFFDGHGWNMAFDHARGQLNGIYDFADSGIGPVHQDFIYSSFVSPDLTARIVDAYEALTGRAFDRQRIHVLTGYHRLSELAELANDPHRSPTMIRNVETWAARSQ